MDWITSMVDRNSGKTPPVIIKSRHLLNNATFERTNLLQILSVITKRLPTTSLTQVQFSDVPSQNKKNTDILNNSMTLATGTGSKMMTTKICPSDSLVSNVSYQNFQGLSGYKGVMVDPRILVFFFDGIKECEGLPKSRCCNNYSKRFLPLRYCIK